MIDRLVLLVRIATRNLLASPINLLIGGLLFFGTIVFVVLGGLLDSLNTSMARSVVGSLAGHVQIYSAKSKDELALFGQMGGDPDLAAMTEFPRLKAALEGLPNVQAVVPMGLSGALITSGNVLDRTLESLRGLYRVKRGEAKDPALGALPPDELDRRIQDEKAHVRQIIKVLRGDVEKATRDLMDAKAVDPENRAALAKVDTQAFWDGFDGDPYGALEFLENRIAPQVTDAPLLFLRYVGTDLDAFQQSFDRMRIVKGTPVPKGQRGFLVAELFYEEQMKLKTARRLDKIKDALALGRVIATDDELKRFVKENRTQTREIVLQLDATKTRAAVGALQRFLGTAEDDLEALLEQLFATTDENFAQRYAFFYEVLAPMLELYRVRIGDTLTIKAFTRSGYVQNVNVKVYGTFAFTGLEKSPLAGNTSLMDIMSFRDLYGYLTSDKAAELKELQQQTGARAVTREDAEAALFGEASGEVVAEATPGVINVEEQLTGTGRKLHQEDLIRRVYTQQEIDEGVVLNAAVMLKDPDRLDETILDIQRLAEAQGLPIRAVSWQKASGLLGQIIQVFRVLLFVGVAIIFFIAMVIINNAMMMATIQRTQTIGTMRAIGAQRSLVLWMVLLESIVLGLVFGGLGMLGGTAIVAAIAAKGIAAPNDVMYFFFSGPRLVPTVTGEPLVVALVIILFVTVASTLFPAMIATRISPLRAMQAEE
ncbi:MAG: FtsX-like permease family protein [Myxococcota bacterium]